MLSTYCTSPEAEYQRNAWPFAQLLEELPELWTDARVELKQELARALDAVLAEIPEFGGLFADPTYRNQLVFRPVAKLRKTDALRKMAKRNGLLSVGCTFAR